MQNNFERKFVKIISRRNTESYIRSKVISRFLFLFIIGLALGCAAFLSEYNPDNAMDNEMISEHFNSIFVDCETLSDYSVSVLRAAKNDIRHLLFIFISGFTYFCFIASGAIVFSKGFVVGFSSAYFIAVGGKYQDLFPVSSILFFIFANIMLSAILIHFSMKGYLFSYEFRAIKKNRSVLRRAPIAYRYIAALILALGGILIFNLLYCLIVYIT